MKNITEKNPCDTIDKKPLNKESTLHRPIFHDWRLSDIIKVLFQLLKMAITLKLSCPYSDNNNNC